MIVNSMIMALVLLVFVGQLLVIVALYYRARRIMIHLSEKYDKKAERFLKFATSEKDEARKITYEALESAYQKAKEEIDEEIEKW